MAGRDGVTNTPALVLEVRRARRQATVSRNTAAQAQVLLPHTSDEAIFDNRPNHAILAARQEQLGRDIARFNRGPCQGLAKRERTPFTVVVKLSRDRASAEGR